MHGAHHPLPDGRSLLLWLALAWLPATSWAAGWLHAWDGDPGGIVITRDGARLPAQLLLPLEPGDRLRLSDGAAAASIALPNGTVVTRRLGDPEYVVPQDVTASPVLTNFLSWASSLLSTWLSPESAGRRVPIASREASDLPGRAESIRFVSSMTSVVSRREHIVVPFAGGAGPWQVAVSGPSSMNSSVETPQVVLQDAQTGRYTIRVTDSAGVHGQAALRIVDAPRLPAYPDEFVALADPDRTVLKALYLARSRLGEHRLDAVQMLRALDSYQQHPLVVQTRALLEDPHREIVR